MDTYQNTQLITSFYDAFIRGDAYGMTKCYDDNIIFCDPAFGTLKGDVAKKMWHMLIERSKGDLQISFSDLSADEQHGTAKWTAKYKFSKTGRKVVNHISAQFEFSNGKIIKHTDTFNLWNWSRQALGWKGYVLGWTPWMKIMIQKQSNKVLNKYITSSSQA